MQTWRSPVYSFYEPPSVEYKNNRKVHTFKCKRAGCDFECHRYLETDTSTGNLARHAKGCWGKSNYDTVAEIGAATERKQVLERLNSTGTLTVSSRNSEPNYMKRDHTMWELR